MSTQEASEPWQDEEPSATKRYPASSGRSSENERTTVLRLGNGDDAAWQLIKDIIDGSDYYVVILGGRYGSLDETGIGYAEKEYDYAVSQKKPVIPLLHKNPDNLPRDKTETASRVLGKLKKFRQRVEDKHTCASSETA